MGYGICVQMLLNVHEIWLRMHSTSPGARPVGFAFKSAPLAACCDQLSIQQTKQERINKKLAKGQQTLALLNLNPDQSASKEDDTNSFGQFPKPTPACNGTHPSHRHGCCWNCVRWHLKHHQGCECGASHKGKSQGSPINMQWHRNSSTSFMKDGRHNNSLP